MHRPDLARRSLAEGIAAFTLVFAGCGAIVADAEYGGALGVVGIALVFGLVNHGHGLRDRAPVGGAHQPRGDDRFHAQPSLPAARSRRIHPGQCVGAIVAALALLAVWPDQPAQLGATVPTVAVGSALVYEGLLSAFLMFVIMAVATDTRAVGAAAAIAIGGTIGLDALFGGPVTGASMNPARSLGPAIAAWDWHDLWIYVVGPIAGTTLGAFAYQVVRGTPPST